MQLSNFFEKCWSRYVKLTPDAPKIHKLLEDRGERVINDHVAFRTFNLPGISRLELGSVFEQIGYKKVPEDLDFPEKKLKANYYLHPDLTQPKVFISELLVEKFPKDLQSWIHSIVEGSRQLSKPPTLNTFLEPSWDPIRLEDYQTFYPMSEYAAWTAAFGIQLNHFTVSFNSLKTFQDLQALNSFLKTNGLVLNSAGGEIKGTPEELLEQSSTEARKIPWTFSGGASDSIMGCYYEFARRYLIPGTQNFFNGFIPKSANKIFESTYEKQKK
ncbi:MAG: DUF1338 domain-containing protein [Bdellovibrio sp.]|nr:DUF1338 domain-containing protein [Bdellovibrio sp.]